MLDVREVWTKAEIELELDLIVDKSEGIWGNIEDK